MLDIRQEQSMVVVSLSLKADGRSAYGGVGIHVGAIDAPFSGSLTISNKAALVGSIAV